MPVSENQELDDCLHPIQNEHHSSKIPVDPSLDKENQNVDYSNTDDEPEADDYLVNKLDLQQPSSTQNISTFSRTRTEKISPDSSSLPNKEIPQCSQYETNLLTSNSLTDGKTIDSDPQVKCAHTTTGENQREAQLATKVDGESTGLVQCPPSPSSSQASVSQVMKHDSSENLAETTTPDHLNENFDSTERTLLTSSPSLTLNNDGVKNSLACNEKQPNENFTSKCVAKSKTAFSLSFPTLDSVEHNVIPGNKMSTTTPQCLPGIKSFLSEHTANESIKDKESFDHGRVSTSSGGAAVESQDSSSTCKSATAPTANLSPPLSDDKCVKPTAPTPIHFADEYKDDSTDSVNQKTGLASGMVTEQETSNRNSTSESVSSLQTLQQLKAAECGTLVPTAEESTRHVSGTLTKSEKAQANLCENEVALQDMQQLGTVECETPMAPVPFYLPDTDSAGSLDSAEETTPHASEIVTNSSNADANFASESFCAPKIDLQQLETLECETPTTPTLHISTDSDELTNPAEEATCYTPYYPELPEDTPQRSSVQTTDDLQMNARNESHLPSASSGTTESTERELCTQSNPVESTDYLEEIPELHTSADT